MKIYLFFKKKKKKEIKSCRHIKDPSRSLMPQDYFPFLNEIKFVRNRGAESSKLLTPRSNDTYPDKKKICEESVSEMLLNYS